MASKAKRTGGAFWQDCSVRGCTRRAQASLTPEGKPILCRDHQVDRAVRDQYLEQPSKTEKQAFIASKPRKRATAKQAVKSQRRAENKAKATSKRQGRKRPAKKAA